MFSDSLIPTPSSIAKRNKVIELLYNFDKATFNIWTFWSLQTFWELKWDINIAENI